MIAAVGMLILFAILTACTAIYAQSGDESAGSAVVAIIFLFYGVDRWVRLAWTYYCVSCGDLADSCSYRGANGMTYEQK